jgi:uncharacterized membrane protein YdfJ with MMPL/SSD domain
MGKQYARMTPSLALIPCSFSVATVFISTTTLIAIQMKFVKHMHVAFALAFFAFFGFLDG